jgi:hypothetical protein
LNSVASAFAFSDPVAVVTKIDAGIGRPSFANDAMPRVATPPAPCHRRRARIRVREESHVVGVTFVPSRLSM